MRNHYPVSAFLVTLVCWSGAADRAAAEILATRVNPANGHTYHLLAPSTWTDAEAEANLLGGHLVTINDAAEEAWLGGFLNLGIQVRDSLWTGFNDVDQEGVFRWISGEPVTYTNWSSGEPNNVTGTPSNPGDPGEDYVQAWIRGNPKWNDIKDNRPILPYPNGVIEISAVPEPTSAISLAAGALLLLVGKRKRRANGQRRLE